MSIPIYQIHGKTYEADTCRPFEDAARNGQIRHESLVHGHYPGRRLPPKALPGVKVVGFWDADHRQGWGLDWHRNEGIELTFLERGKLGFAVEDYRSLLQAGDLTFTRPWQRHRVGDPEVGPGRLHFLILDVGVRRPHQAWHWPSWIVLTTDDLRQLTNFLRHNEQPVWRASEDVACTFGRIGTAVESDFNGSGISNLAVYINQLFLSLLEMFQRQEVHLDETLSTIQRTVELFWADLCQDSGHLALEWTVRSMARRCGMGITNFTHHTKQLVNMTPMQYLNHCRLNAAARLLKEQPGRSVTDVALSYGFASSQYFTTLFRRQFGAAPRKYRSGG